MNLKIKDISLIAILSVLLFLQKEILSFLPNISLTMLLIILFSRKLGLIKTLLIITIFCILDNLLLSSFNMVFTPFLLLGWMLIPLLLCTVFKNINNIYYLAILGVLFSFLYCWIFIIPNTFILNIDVFTYLISDLSFEIIFAVGNLLSILWLYKPCSKTLDSLLNK